jgi:hypothetical protein
MAAKMAMMAMTTSSSIKVNPPEARCGERGGRFTFDTEEKVIGNFIGLI